MPPKTTFFPANIIEKREMSARKLRWRKDGARDIPVEEACWQYLVDHAFKTNQNTIKAIIEIPNKEAFLTRLKARIEGKYRYSEEELWQQPSPSPQH